MGLFRVLIALGAVLAALAAAPGERSLPVAAELLPAAAAAPGDDEDRDDDDGERRLRCGRATVAGAARVGEVLTPRILCEPREGVAYAYAWQRCSSRSCAVVARTRAYRVVADDAGLRLRVLVLASRDGRGVLTASPLTAPIEAPPPPPPPPPPVAPSPVPGAPPVVTPARPTVGATLVATPGSWVGTPPLAFTLTWQRCDAAGATCSAIAGAGGETYVVAPADAGHALRVEVAARNVVGVASAASSPTSVVPAPVTGSSVRPAFGAVRGLAVAATPTGVRLTWSVPASPQLARVVVVRRLGARPRGVRDGTVVYRGRGRTAADFPLSSRRVWYAAFAIRRNGSAARPAVAAIPSFLPPLWAPREGGRVSAARRPTFAWRPVTGATYYNVQVWRSGASARRVVTTWSRLARLTLDRRLAPGSYTWFVFPGFGSMRTARYGALLGQGTFRVR